MEDESQSNVINNTKIARNLGHDSDKMRERYFNKSSEYYEPLKRFKCCTLLYTKAINNRKTEMKNENKYIDECGLFGYLPRSLFVRMTFCPVFVGAVDIRNELNAALMFSGSKAFGYDDGIIVGGDTCC